MVRLSALAALLVMCAGPSLAATGDWPAKVDPWVHETVARDGTAEYLVFLAEQADLSEAARLRRKADKGAYVHDRLRAVAARTQAPLVEMLTAAGVPHRTYWVANMIWVSGDASLLETLAKRSDVAHVFANPRVAMPTPDIRAAGTESPEAIEPNLVQIGIPSVFWAAGVTGEGIVIGGQDTGYEWQHPAIRDQYRGWDGQTADHNYNWHDAIHSGGGVCGADSPVPCDDDNHGTHTMGTMVGDDGGSNQIGAAPGARWIGCRNMDRGNGTPATYSECFQFFIAPTDLNDQNPRPDLAPHVINNSWSCPPSEGCTDPEVLRTVVDNARAAGIMVVVSAGNSGSSCSSVETPAAIYDASVTVGSVNLFGEISTFSSRGPVTFDGSGRLKPDLTAPGESIRSSIRGGGYAFFSGTSMSGPHVAGMAALLMSAQSCLTGDVDATEDFLKSTTTSFTTVQSCGGVPGDEIPNNTYGYGTIASVMPGPADCGAPVGGGAGGLSGGIAICVNRTTGTNAFGPLDNALAWDCEAAGLATAPGDQIVMRVRGGASGNTLAGTITGVAGQAALCRNVTTGQSVNVPLAGARTWDCSSAGLNASPGQLVLQTIIGIAD